MKEKLEDFFNAENAKLSSIIEADQNGVRLLSSIVSEVERIKKEVIKIKDPGESLKFLLNELANMTNRFSSISAEINASRRETLSRVTTIKVCYNMIVEEEKRLEKEREEMEKAKASEEKRLEELAKEIASGRDPEKEVRKPKTRPERIKDVRNAKAKLDKSKNIT